MVGREQMAEACSSLLQRPWSASLASAYSGVGHCLLRLGRFEEANKLLKAPPGRGPVPAADVPWEEWSLFVVRNRVLTHAGHLHEAEEVLVDAYDQVAHYPEAEARAYVAAELALLHLEQGRARSAIRRADESRAVYQQLGRSLRAEWSTLLKARALALAGQADRAAGALAEYDLMGLAVHEQGDPERMEACGWVAAAGGDLTAARGQFEAAADLSEEIGDLYIATKALHSLARIGHARQVAARLNNLAAQFKGDSAATSAAYAGRNRGP